jgi:2-haloacid dehalogenase
MISNRRSFLSWVGGATGAALASACTRPCPPSVSPVQPSAAAVGTANAPLSDAGTRAAPAPVATSTEPAKVRVLFFDAFPIFDPRPVFVLGEQLFPGRGSDLGNAWRTRQFEYTWLRTASRHYKDFWSVTGDALSFACDSLKLELTQDKREQLMNAYLALPVYPDVVPALDHFKRAGLKLAFLSNMTDQMLVSCIRKARLDGYFDAVLSTHEAQTYKPDPRAYQLGLDRLGVAREEAVFVAFAGWDAYGAKLFGYKTFWTNRLKLSTERLDVTPDGEGSDLAALVTFLQPDVTE